jgi:hypothetical protein
MRLNRVLRFTFVCLLAGAFLGLIFGLAFGQSKGGGTLSVAVNDTVSPQDTPTTVADHTSVNQVMTPERAKLIGANEMGLVLVIVYNKISADATDSSTRTPQTTWPSLAARGSTRSTSATCRLVTSTSQRVSPPSPSPSTARAQANTGYSMMAHWTRRPRSA